MNLAFSVETRDDAIIVLATAGLLALIGCAIAYANWARVKAIPARAWKCLAVAAGVLLWLTFIWPTPYRYLKEGSRNVRVNRFTGNVSELYGGQWTP